MAIKIGMIEPDKEELVKQSVSWKSKVPPLSRSWKIFFTVAGGLLTFLSISFILLAFYTLFNLNTSRQSWFLPVIEQSCIGWISLFFGILFLIKGLQNIISMRNERLIIEKDKSIFIRHRNWGWVLATIGGLILAFGIYFAFPNFMYGDQDYFFEGIFELWPFMMIGVPILILGFWFIVNQRKNEQEEIDN